MKNVVKFVVPFQVFGLLLVSLQIASVANGLPFATEGDPSVYALPVKSVSLVSADQVLSWNGRAISVWDNGVAVKVTPMAVVGGFIRSSSGHGSSGQTHYSANGWDVWGTYTLQSDDGKQPTLTLGLEHLHEADTVLLNSPTEFFQATPRVDTTGIELRVQTAPQRLRWIARVGYYSTQVFEENLSDILLIGVGSELKLTPNTTSSLALTQYYDNFNGNHFSYLLRGGIVYRLHPHWKLGLSASYFPRGIPLAGDPLSSASAVGAAIGGNTTASGMHVNSFGYLTLALTADL